MIKYLPVFLIAGAVVYLFLKAFDFLLNTAVYFHSLHSFRLVFDDYEAELIELESGGKTGDIDKGNTGEEEAGNGGAINETGIDETDKGVNARTGSKEDALVELKFQLADELACYRKLVAAHPRRYRFWKLVFGENKLVRAVECSAGDNPATTK